MTDTTPALARPQHDRLIAGVCGGIARRFGWDSTIVRACYALISILFVAFPGILLYIILWIIMPRD